MYLIIIVYLVNDLIEKIKNTTRESRFSISILLNDDIYIITKYKRRVKICKTYNYRSIMDGYTMRIRNKLCIPINKIPKSYWSIKYK